MATKTIFIQLEEGVTDVLLRLLPVGLVSPPHVKGEPGIDVSRWQAEIDWERVAVAGVRFAGIRATTGAIGKDIQFARNWAESKRVHIQRLAYHYFINGLEPVSQLNNFLSTVGDDLGELPLVLDIEPRNISTDPNVTIYETVNKSQNTEYIHHWLTLARERTGRPVAIYCSAWSLSMCTTYPIGSLMEWIRDYPLWLAHHTLASAPRIPSPWTRYMVWQYSRTGRVAGINGNVDLDRWGDYP